MRQAAIEFEITPHESAGLLRFGMTSEQVRALLSPHPCAREPARPCDTFTALGVRVHYAQPEAVEAIEFRGPAFPTLAGRRLLRQRYGDLEAWLLSIDTAVKLEHSGLTSIQLGIRLYAASAGRHPDAPIEVVSLFDRGYARRYIASVWPPPL